jgi:hypothetical protein
VTNRAVFDLPLSHFSVMPVGVIRSVAQRAEPDMKPQGLWVSVDGEDDWPSWCRSEDFATERLAYRHVVRLAETANILWLESGADIDNFHRKFSNRNVLRENSYFPLNLLPWSEVAALYQGIIIAPYQWSHRLDGPARWYYTWDCASGCIWDAAAIMSVDLAEPAANQNERAA